MHLRALLTLCLGLVVAGSAAAYTHLVLQAPRSGPAMQDLVVASIDIGFGHVITEDMLTVRQWPEEAVPDGVFVSIEQVMGAGEQEPRRAKRAITAGEPLLGAKVSDFGEKVTITERIDPDMRAVAIRVNDVTGVAGFVTPSDRVDITLTRMVDQTLRASTILQDVKVLGIDQAADGVRNKPSVVKTVTVQVRPAEVQKLALAQQAGTLSLSLRHLDAAGKPVLGDITVGDLAESVQPKRRSRTRISPSVMVNRAGERTRVAVPRS